MTLKVSIVIPTRNGMPLFAEVLDRIQAQRCSLPFRLLCVDTASGDGTWEEIGRRQIQRVRIEPSEFGHGKTRNLGFSLSDGDLLVSTVQDATPADDRWLQTLVDAVTSAEDVAGAYSRQLPRPDLNPLLERRLLAWSAGRTEPRVQRLAAGSSLSDLEPLEQLSLCAFDDVSSIMRRSVWEDHPLPERRFGEDVAWGQRVIEAGLAIVFEPRSRVLHSHDDGAWIQFQRIYEDHRNLNELFGVTTVPTFRDAWNNSLSQIRVYRRMLEELELPEGKRRSLERFALRCAFAETFGQWLGARAVRKGPPRGIFRLLEKVLLGS